MKKLSRSILLVSSTRSIIDPLSHFCRTHSLGLEVAASLTEIRGVGPSEVREADLVVLDLQFQPGPLLRSATALHQVQPDLPIALIVDQQTAESLEEAVSAGVSHFLSRAGLLQELEDLVETLSGAASPAAIPPSAAGMHITPFDNGDFFLAGSPAMLEILSRINRIGPPDLPVLITGESGVGKEAVARMLHLRSGRASRPLLKVNCAALPPDLLESELFGYEAGAFTGALKAKPGKFDQCEKGTILLDEIGEMSASLQAKLLQVLQDGSFSRLGSRVESRTDVRVLAATNINIEQALANRTFREDLFYRLNAFTIEVPPLRERRVEIPYLLEKMSERFAGMHKVEPTHFSPELVSAAVSYSWPGNLRELGNFVRRHLIMRDEAMALVDLQQKVPARPPRPAPDTNRVYDYSGGLKAASRCAKDEAETVMLQAVLEDASWNRRVAAERLKISYKALLYKMRQYHLDAPDSFVAQRTHKSTSEPISLRT